MALDDERDHPREIRLEGWLLGLASGLLLLLLLCAFQLGRTVERWAAPARTVSSSESPGNAEPDTPEKESPTFFDTTTGPGKEAEPGREAQAKAPPPTQPLVPVTAGAWFVQVFVGRDRQAAEEVVRSLRAKRYAVRIDAVAEGASGSLFKVRVGGFPDREAADAAAEKLKVDGHSSTWVVRVPT